MNHKLVRVREYLRQSDLSQEEQIALGISLLKDALDFPFLGFWSGPENDKEAPIRLIYLMDEETTIIEAAPSFLKEKQ